jgi:hypothetical protein
MTRPSTGSRYWDERLETLAPERRALLREHRLHWQLRRCWDGSPFYRAQLEAAGLDPATFDGTRDWRRLLPLEDEDLPDLHAWAVAPEAWWDHVDAAPGVPSRVVTDGDAIHQRDLVARALWAGGIRPLYGLSNFDYIHADGIDYGAVIVGGAGRIETLESGIRGDEVAEPEALWADVWPRPGDSNTYPAVALFLDIGTPTVTFTCQDAGVLHWIDDHFLIETVDPASGEPVPAGGVGAVLVTDLTREGSPLLRYRTGLEAALSDEPCPCGRTSAHSDFVRRLT